jgi:hypothetical protein
MAVAAAGVLLLPSGAVAVGSAERRALDALSRLFTDGDAIRGVGRVCRGCVDVPTVGAVAGDLGTTVGNLATLDRATLRRRVDRRIRADFAAGRVVSVDGWVLSRTEARLYALVNRAQRW